MKKIEGLTPAANCNTAPISGTGVTLYVGPLEVRDWKSAGTATTPPETIYAYPVPNIRLVFDDWANSTTPSPLYATALHRDALGNVRAVTGFSTDATKQGKMTERSVFRPYGQAVPFDKDITVPNESKGFIGERYDGDAGLQYLNARYYDPKLAMFIQPDWWEVTKEGVGTNRYSYSFDDPVNGKDPTGHEKYGSSVSDKDKDKLKDDFDKARDRLRETIAAADSIAKNGGRAITKDAKALLARMETANGVRSVSDASVKKMRTLAQKELSGIGEFGKGIMVSRNARTTPDEKWKAAVAGLNSNAMTIYDGYFSGSASYKVRSLVHEGSHAILGKSDKISQDAFAAAPRRAIGIDVVEATDSNGEDVFYGYNWTGVDLARQFGMAGNHNDTYVCQVMSGC